MALGMPRWLQIVLDKEPSKQSASGIRARYNLLGELRVRSAAEYHNVPHLENRWRRWGCLLCRGRAVAKRD